MSLTARGFLGAGSLQFSLIVNGIAMGYGAPRETSKFEIKPNSDIKELTSKGKESYGQIIETVGIAKPADVTITLLEADYQNLMLSFMGSDGVGANQASAAVTEEVVVMKLDKYVELAKRNLVGTGIVLTHTTGLPVYTQGVDYDVIYLTGQIRALVGGVITDLQSCKVDYTANAFTSKKIMGGTQPDLRAKILFSGKNLADDTPVLITCWEGMFTPDAAFDLLADKFGEVNLKGRLKTPLGKASPFEVEFLSLV